MHLTRVYADAGGESHFEDLDIPLTETGALGALSELMPADGVIFRENEPGYDLDWHRAPRRQYIVLLDGAIEITVSDGASRAFRGGDVVLVEDTVGRGHRTRNIRPEHRRSLFIPLPQEA